MFPLPTAAMGNAPRCLGTTLALPPPPLLTHLKGCRTMTTLKQHHAIAIKTGRIEDTVLAAEILRFAALSHSRDLHYARKFFDQMVQRNCFSWNTVIRALSESDGCALEGVLLFCRMLQDGLVTPNRYTYPSVLKACVGSTGVEEGRQVHAHVIKYGLDSDGYVASNLVRVYAVSGRMRDACRVFEKCSVSSTSDASVVLQNVIMDGWFKLGLVGEARQVFDGMPARTVISWNAVISGYTSNGFFKEAVDVFQQMQMGGVKPNHVTLVSILPAISRLGAIDLGKWVHIYAEKNGINVDDVLGSALIDMYGKCGNIEKVIQVFEELPKNSAITWSALIGALAMHGRAEDALDYFSLMEKTGVTPTDVVFIGVLNACSHAGLVERGRAYFDQMVTIYGLKPRIEHYGCMVDMLGRAGRLKEAEKLVLNMPIEPDDVILKALLGACKIHKNVDIGARVAKQLMQMSPHDSGCYVLLSNLYASVGDWDGVANVRLMMKELDIKKDPGCSWITVDGKVHEFVVEDDSHSRTKEIYHMLDEMSDKLKSAGYNPDTSQVLLNIDKKEKEILLTYHSEKIAVAFGIISTGPGTTLHVVKNLRVCIDCHSALKLISKIYNRRIIVRDRTRFHHFENGSCSCKDYW